MDKTIIKNKVLTLIQVGMGVFTLSCTTLPSTEHKHYGFPDEEAYMGDAKKPYKVLGLVRSKVNYVSLDPVSEEKDLCRNYFNKAVKDLVKYSQEKGGDGVIGIKSVVFLEDGHIEKYSKPECADDGLEGQVLAEGIAIQWKKEVINN